MRKKERVVVAKVTSNGIARVVLLQTFSSWKMNSASSEDLNHLKLLFLENLAVESPSLQLSLQNTMAYRIYTKSKFFTIFKTGTKKRRPNGNSAKKKKCDYNGWLKNVLLNRNVPRSKRLLPRQLDWLREKQKKRKEMKVKKNQLLKKKQNQRQKIHLLQVKKKTTKLKATTKKVLLEVKLTSARKSMSNSSNSWPRMK